MSMGFIIFLITIAISLFSAIGDKQHEKRQKQQPPRPKQQQKPAKGFFDQVQESIQEIEQEIKQAMNDDTPKESKAPTQTRTPQKDQTPQTFDDAKGPLEPPPSEYESPANVNRRHDEESARQALQDMVTTRMNELDDEMHRERQKQLARIERRAKAIIQDEYLSQRTKEIKLKALTNATNAGNKKQHSLAFSDNEVVNGMIWSEILNKPKQLR
ncbi:hypothetical protein [Staphylococcus sp. 17KM0847]|uniref:hypothetical protein n=1 Tax=Staphylococcus sp. 17KM0847 TaxID=2583989 RepID=UPI0015DCC857|nr:hypothetical protein [Staphylococcus sp. 17KM0847]QLK86047.1 hypothetical protein FGL66_04645 [Staphylococcus sp. 17KM0847]